MTLDNERAWQLLFDELDLKAMLAAEGYAPVSAEQIKSLTGREPRLMAKFDTREQRPAVLRQSHSTIVPVTNQQYWVLSGDGYRDVPFAPLPKRHQPIARGQLFFETLPLVPHSEAEALEIAHTYGILEDFVGETVYSTRRGGRRRTPRFEYRFQGARSLLVPVDGVQVEIDALYEGDRVYLVEAKMGTRGNFIIRQLYYPLRMLRTGDRVSKPIVPIFLTWSGGVFTLHQFAFRDEADYHALVHVRSQRYTFDHRPATALSKLLAATHEEPERTDVPFPQANDIDKVSDIVDAVVDGITDPADIAERYGFDQRHSGYYAHAANYLGFLANSDEGFVATDAGAVLARDQSVGRCERIAQRILAAPVFRRAAEETLSGTEPPVDNVAAHVLSLRPELSEATARRRAQSALAWVRWMVQTFPEG